MPFNTEDLADKFGSSAEDIRKNLDGLIEKAEDADKAFENLTKRQEYASKIQDKFATAMTASSKSMVLFGRSGNTAVRGLKAVGAISRTVASSLGSIGVGAGAAAGGFKALSSEASSFTSDISRTERSIAGFVAKIGGLEKKLKGIKSTSVPVEMVVGNLSALDNIEKRLKALPKNIKVKISTAAGAANASKPPSARVAPASARVTQKALSAAAAKAAPASARVTQKALTPVQKAAASASAKAAKAAAATASKQQTAEQKRYELEGELRKKSSYRYPRSDEGRTAKKKEEEIGKARESAKYRQVSEFVEELEPKKKDAFLLDKKIMGLDKAVEKLITDNKNLGEEVVRDMAKAQEAVEELYSPFNQLQEEMEKTAKSFKGLFKKDIAGGAVKELEDFAGGAAKSATGMMAAGLAIAYLATKLGDLARKFADAAIGLAKYKTEMAAMEDTISGISRGALDEMRKELNLTREQAAGFFEQVRRGANDLNMSRDKIMAVSKALSDTFGGNQTDRLKQYIDLLESIPTIESDLKVTASMDDQAASIFALAKAGKMESVIELQGAGLLGGKQEKEPGADTANAALKTAAFTENISDTLLSAFPKFGIQLASIVEWAAKGVVAISAVSAAVSALRFMVGSVAKAVGGVATATGTASAANLANRIACTAEIVSAMGMSNLGGVAGKAGKAVNTVTRDSSGRFTKAGVSTAAKVGGKVVKALRGKSGATAVKAATTAGKAAKVISKGEIMAQGMGRLANAATVKSSFKASAAMTKFGATVAKAGPKMFGLGLATVGVELALGLAADKLEETGHKAAAAGVGIAKSAASIAGWALTGATFGAMITGPLAPFGVAIGAAAGALTGLVLEGKSLWKNFKQLGKSAREWMTADDPKPSTALSEAEIAHAAFLQSENEAMSRSGLALQLSMNRLDRATKSAKFELLELNGKLSKMELGNISDIGGSMAGFSNALEQGTYAAKKTYDEQMKIAVSERKRISSDSNMSAQDRETGLRNVHEVELQAASNFASAVDGVIAAIWNNPALKQTQLKQEKMQIPLTRASEVGSMSMAELNAAYKPLIENAQQEIVEAAKAAADAEAATQKMKATFAKDEKDAIQAGHDLILKNQKELASDTISTSKRRVLIEEQSRLEAAQKKGFVESAPEELAAANARKAVYENKIDANATASSGLINTDEIIAAGAAQEAYAKKKILSDDAATKMTEAKNEVKTVGMTKENIEKEEKAISESGTADKATQDAKKVVDELKDSIGNKLRSKGLEGNDIAKVVDVITGAKGDAKEVSSQLQGMGDNFSGADEIITDMVATFNSLVVETSDLKKQAGVVKDSINIHEKIVGLLDSQTKTIEAEVRTAKESEDANKKLVGHYRALLSSVTSDVRQKQELVVAAEQDVAIAGLTGSATKERAKLGALQNSLSLEEYSVARERLKFAEGAVRSQKAAIAVDEEKLSKMPEGDDKEAKRGALKTDKNNLAAFEAEVSGLKELAGKAASNLKVFGQNINDALIAFETSIVGIDLGNLDSLAGVIADTADLFGDVGTAADKSFNMAKKSSTKRLAEEKKIIDENLKKTEDAQKDSVDAQYKKNISNNMTPEAAEAIRQKDLSEMKSVLSTKAQLEYGRAELKQKQDVVKWAQRSKDLKSSEVDIQQGMVDDAMSFASEFGGSFASINALQQMNVGLAQQELDIAKQFRDRVQKTFEEAAGSAEDQAAAGMALMKANADVAAKTLGLRRKELGVQKDIMDRLLGRVFGELNANFGARRGMGSDVGIMGVGATRMKSANGVYVNDVPGGKPGTIAERQAKRMAGGMSGGVWGEGSGAGGPLDELAKQGGPMAEVAKALSKGPTREQQDVLANAMSGTEANTAIIAAAVTGRPLVGLGGGRAASGAGTSGVVGQAAKATTGKEASQTQGTGVAGSERIDKVVAGAVKAVNAKTVNAGASGATAKTEASRYSDISAKKGAELAQAQGLYKNTMTDLNKAGKARAGQMGMHIRGEGPMPDEKEGLAHEKIRKGLKDDVDAKKAASVSAYRRAVFAKMRSDEREKEKARGPASSHFGGLSGNDNIKAGLKMGGLDTGGFGLRGTKASSLVGSRTLKATGGIQTLGGGSKGLSVSKGGLSTSSRNSELASKAAGEAVAPRSVEQARSVASAGTATEAGSGSGGMEIKGEMLVKFDNKAFREVMAPVVVRIMGEPDGSKVINNVAFGGR